MDTSLFLEQFSYLAESPGSIQKLRNLILDLAVRGKLVPQDPDDEPASELLKRIAIEKERLLKEGKIKQHQAIQSITEDEKPFEIPASWRWVRFNQIVTFSIGRTPERKQTEYWSPGSIPWVSIADLNHTSTVSFTKEMVSEKASQEIFREPPSPEGTILMSFKLTIGKISILSIDAYHNEAIISIYPILDELKGYIFKALQAVDLLEEKSNAIKGSTLNTTSISRIKIPLPPLAEQYRIIARVDELMQLCDQLEEEQAQQGRLHDHATKSTLYHLTSATSKSEALKYWQFTEQHFHELFDRVSTVEELRATILQLAVQGKLVPQNPDDEPADELLKRIEAEKERLIKAGEIKKPEKLPPIRDDEKPYELPQGWEWVRFTDLGELSRGKSKHRPRNDPMLYKDGKYPLVQTGNVAAASRNGGFIKDYTSCYNDIGLAQSRLWPRGTMCITIAANIADSGILSFDACFPDSVVGFIPFRPIQDARYFEYFMRTAKSRLLDFAPSTAQKNINLGILSSLGIPLPPISTLRRIVAKLDALMQLCDELEKETTQSREFLAKLTDSTIYHLFGPVAEA